MLSNNQVKRMENEGYDFDYMERILPTGGIQFTEDKIKYGSNFCSCVHVYQLPNHPLPFWMTKLIGNPNTLTKIDIRTINKEKVITSLENSVSELRYQAKKGRTAIDRDDARTEMLSMEEFAQRINRGGDIPKVLHIRIFVTGSTQEELERRVSELLKALKAKDYRATVFLGAQKEEWLSLSMPASEQEQYPVLPDGVQVNSDVIGGGFPFNHQSLIDPCGCYIGETDTHGAFIFDPFQVTTYRKSFSAMVLGKSGFGKSTLLKMIADGMSGRNCFIRGFELNRDWRKWVESKDGQILDLSGEQGMLNPLEPMGTISDDTGTRIRELESYTQHRARFFTLVQFLNPDLSKVDIQMFHVIFDDFYIDKGLLPPHYQANRQAIHIIGRDPQEYPTIEEFYHFYKDYVKDPNRFHYTSDLELKSVNDFEKVLYNMAYSNGNIFNGHTTLKGLDQEKILFFDLQSIDGMDENIKACLIFQAINIIWQQALTNGMKQKARLNAGEVTREDLTYFLFIMDECQNILKPQYAFAIDYIAKFVKEMRKFSAGIYFATQSPQELLPEDASEEYARQIKMIFELCNNRFFLRIDNSVNDVVRRAMGNAFEESEYTTLNNLEQGEVVVYLGGNENYKIKVLPDADQLKVFDGGH